MSYLVRKIKISLWPDCSNGENFNIENLSADALTQDLRTTSNTLSMWEIENLHELDDVCIAIAVTRNEVIDFDILIFNKEEIEETFELEKTQGDTSFENFKNKHYDIRNLNLEKITCFAKKIVGKLNSIENIHMFSIQDNKQKIYSLYKDNQFNREFLEKKNWKKFINNMTIQS